MQQPNPSKIEEKLINLLKTNKSIDKTSLFKILT
jgi:hypothetical protein